MVNATDIYIERETMFHRLDPRTKILFMVVFSILSLIFSDPFFLFIILLICLVFWFEAQIPIRRLLGLYKYVTFSIVLLIIIQGLTFPEEGYTPILRIIPPNPLIGNVGALTYEGLILGIAMSLRIIILMIVGPLVIYTTALDKLIIGLLKLKVPYLFAFTFSSALNLLPSIQNKANDIIDAQKSRGLADLESQNIAKRLKSYASLLIPLIVSSMRDSVFLSLAMNSRAFGFKKERTYYREIKFTKLDIVASVLFLILFVIFIYIRFILGLGGLAFY